MRVRVRGTLGPIRTLQSLGIVPLSAGSPRTLLLPSYLDFPHFCRIGIHGGEEYPCAPARRMEETRPPSPTESPEMFLSRPILSVFSHFRSAFTRPTWEKVQVLVTGTLLARGRRTVAAALARHRARAGPPLQPVPCRLQPRPLVGPGARAPLAPAAGPGLRTRRRADPGRQRDPGAAPRAQDRVPTRLLLKYTLRSSVQMLQVFATSTEHGSYVRGVATTKTFVIWHS